MTYEQYGDLSEKKRKELLEWLNGRYVIKTFIRALLFEDDRKTKLSEVFRGISDGLSNEHRAEWRKC